MITPLSIWQSRVKIAAPATEAPSSFISEFITCYLLNLTLPLILSGFFNIIYNCNNNYNYLDEFL